MASNFGVTAQVNFIDLITNPARQDVLDGCIVDRDHGEGLDRIKS